MLAGKSGGRINQLTDAWKKSGLKVEFEENSETSNVAKHLFGAQKAYKVVIENYLVIVMEVEVYKSFK